MPSRRVAYGRKGLATLALCAAAGLAGCADLSRAVSLAPGPVDPESGVADTVRTASSADFPRPRFRDIPPEPTDVRPTQGWRASVDNTLTAGQALTAWTSANPAFIAGDPEAFAEGQRASIPANERGAPEATAAAGTEAFAARLRAMADPPPAPK